MVVLNIILRVKLISMMIITTKIKATMIEKLKITNYLKAEILSMDIQEKNLMSIH